MGLSFLASDPLATLEMGTNDDRYFWREMNEPARRNFRDRFGPIEYYTEGEFQRRFRLPKDTVSDLWTMGSKLARNIAHDDVLPPFASTVKTR